MCLQYLQNLSSVISILSSEHARGYDWQYAYAGAVARDGRVDINSRIDPEGRVVAVAYSGSGRVSGVTNALGHTTNYTFDYIKSRKEFYLKTSYPGGRVTETWYERDGEVKRRDINGINIITITEDLRKDIETDTFGRVTTKENDEFRNLLKTTYPDGTSTSTTYNVTNSNVLTRTDERGTVTKYEYWPNGRLKKMTEALGTTVERNTEYTYDSFGQMLTMTQVGDAVTATAITQYFFDGFGNVSKIIDAELNERQFTSYDSQGNNLIMLDERANIWTNSYDNLGNLTSDKNPLNEERINEYDKVGNLIKTTYPDNNFIQFTYDSRNRKIKKIDELGNMLIDDYNSAGNVIARTDEEGRITNYNHDMLNRLYEIIDPKGNKTTINFPNLNHNLYSGSIYQTIRNDYPTYSNEYKYNLKGKIIEQKTTYQLTNGQTQIEVIKFKYDAKNNRIEFIDSGNNVYKTEFNEFNQITKQIDPQMNITESSFDNRGNWIRLKNSLDQTKLFSYDKLNRKVSESEPMGQLKLFDYDSTGNLKSFTDAKNQKSIHEYNIANRLERIKYYKVNQILDKTVSFSYNLRGKLVQYDDGISQGSYVYDNAQQKLSENVIYG